MPAALNPDTPVYIVRAFVANADDPDQLALSGHGMPRRAPHLRVTTEVAEVGMYLRGVGTVPLDVETLTEELSDVPALTLWLGEVWCDLPDTTDDTVDIVDTLTVAAPVVPHPLKSARVRRCVTDALKVAGWASVSPATGRQINPRHYAARDADGHAVLYYVVTPVKP